MKQKQNLLLLEDVYGLGKKGEIVGAKPGYARNFLIPKKRALVAHKNILKMQDRLQQEREKQAAEDRKESEAIAQKLDGMTLKIEVKIDPEGHLYGSVSVKDIVELFKKEGIEMDRHFVRLGQPIKELGSHRIPLQLKEGVTASVKLEVTPEGGVMPAKKPKQASKEELEEEKAEAIEEMEKQAEE